MRLGAGPSQGRHQDHGQQDQSAAGKSQEIWLPISRPEQRVRPVGPQWPLVPVAATDHAARLVAGQAAETVVTENEVEQAVVLRPADVGAVGGRRQHDDHHPPPRRYHHGDARGDQLADAAPEWYGCGQEVGRGQRRHDQERLHHLGDKPKPHQGKSQDEPTGGGLVDGTRRGIGGAAQQQDEQSVGVVEPEHQGRHGGERHNRRPPAGRLRRTPNAARWRTATATAATPSRA